MLRSRTRESRDRPRRHRMELRRRPRTRERAKGKSEASEGSLFLWSWKRMRDKRNSTGLRRRLREEADIESVVGSQRRWLRGQISCANIVQEEIVNPGSIGRHDRQVLQHSLSGGAFKN